MSNSERSLFETKIGIAILAAGRSVRMEQPKQLMHWQGKSLVERAADTAMAVGRCPVIVVAGEQHEAIRRLLADRQCTVVFNRAYEEGIASSVRAATRHFSADAGIESVLFMNCDQPKLTTHHLRVMCDAALEQPGAIVVTDFRNTFGSPALFPRECFNELLLLTGDKGAKLVAQNHSDRLIHIAFEDAALDLDRPADFE